MPTEVLSMLENISVMTDGPVLIINTPEAWIITVNNIEKFRLEKEQ